MNLKSPALAIALTLIGGLSRAQSPVATSDFEKFVNQTKHPVDWMTWGADLRVRDEYYRDANMELNANREYNQIRYRERIWTTLKPIKDIEFNARMTWESREFTTPGEPVPYGKFLLNSWETDEIIVDSLNVRASNLFGQPLSLTAGRQDLFLGNGWFTGDGTPRDGSRTYFLDAARLVLEEPDLKTTFNLIGIYQQAREDAWLPPIDPEAFRKYYTDQNEHAVMLYVINKSIPETELDGYFVYLQDERIPAIAGSVGGEIYAFGARAAANLTEHWKVRSECLPEFGRKNGQTLEAFGSNNRLSYYFLDPLNNNLRLGYEYLSGDDPNSTRTNERFDPLWGRWPQYSELLVYNPTVGPRVMEDGNYHRINCGWSFNPMKKLEFSADYHALFAVQNEPFTSGATTYQTTGHFRGHLATTQLEYVQNMHLKGHLRAEWFFPGDYYNTVPVGPQKDPEIFLRAEVLLTY